MHHETSEQCTYPEYEHRSLCQQQGHSDRAESVRSLQIIAAGISIVAKDSHQDVPRRRYADPLQRDGLLFGSPLQYRKGQLAKWMPRVRQCIPQSLQGPSAETNHFQTSPRPSPVHVELLSADELVSVSASRRSFNVASKSLRVSSLSAPPANDKVITSRPRCRTIVGCEM